VGSLYSYVLHRRLGADSEKILEGGTSTYILPSFCVYRSTEWFLSPDSSGSGSFLGNCRRQKRVKHRATEERGGEDFAGDNNFFIYRTWLTS
jgi:hypothetical protein